MTRFLAPGQEGSVLQTGGVGWRMDRGQEGSASVLQTRMDGGQEVSASVLQSSDCDLRPLEAEGFGNKAAPLSPDTDRQETKRNLHQFYSQTV